MVTSNLLPTSIPNAKEISFLLNWINSSFSTSQAASMLVSLLFISRAEEYALLSCMSHLAMCGAQSSGTVGWEGNRQHIKRVPGRQTEQRLLSNCNFKKKSLLHTACWQLLLWHLIYSHYLGKQVSQDPAVSLLNQPSGLPWALVPQIQVLSYLVEWEQSKNLDQLVSAKMPQTVKKGRRRNKGWGIICASNPY